MPSQVAVTLGVAGGTRLAVAQPSRLPAQGRGALPIGTILATPYSLDYDLMLLAPAIAFLAADGMQRGFRAVGKIPAGRAVARALLARPVAQATLIPLAVPAMLVAFACCCGAL